MFVKDPFKARHIVIVCLLCLLSANLPAENQKTVIKVGYFPGFGFVKDLSSIAQKGYGVDFFQKMEDTSNFHFEYIEVDSLMPIDALNNGDIDVYGPVIKLREREQEVTYFSNPLAETSLILAAKNESEVYYNDVEAINGKMVATYRGNIANEMLIQCLAARGMSVEFLYAEPGSVHLQDADFYLLLSENAISEESISKDFNVVLSFGMKHVFMVTKKGNIELAKQLDEAYLKSLSFDGSLYYDIRSKYLGEESLITKRYLTKEEANLLQGNTFSVGFVEHHEPYQFVNDQGEPDGIYIDVLNSLALEYGFTVEYAAYSIGSRGTHENFDILLSHLGTKEYDLQFYEPTNSFYESPMYLLSHSDSYFNQNSTSVLGMMNYIEDNEIYRTYPKAEIRFFNNFYELVESFKMGFLDNVLFSDAGAEYVERDLTTFEHSISPTGLAIPFRFFISNDLQSDYVPIFNVLFAHLENESLENIVLNQYANFLPSYSLSDFFMDYRILLVFGLILLLAFFFGSIIYLQKDKRKAVLKSLYHDSVTGLLSSSRFSYLASEILKKAKDDEYEMISFEIDSFSMINAAYGLEDTNLIIKGIAEALTNILQDTEALICRESNDVFYIFRRTNAGGKIQSVIGRHVVPAIKSVLGRNYNVSMSIGIYLITDTTQPIALIMNYSFLSRMQARNTHGIVYNTFSKNMKKGYDLQYKVVNKMDQAISQKEFKIVYQPKVSLDSLSIKGAEALVRWEPNDGTTIFPGDFIPLFESNGFIAKLDLYVFEAVCEFIQNNRENIDVPTISVNVSALSFEKDSLVDSLVCIAKRHNVKPKEIELELTESAITYSDEVITKRTKQLKKAGFFVSLDDFGTGVSNLGRLAIINLDTIKLDKIFVDHIEDSENGSTVLQNIITMIQNLHMQVVAEGVENAEQALWLKDLGCDTVQGYFFEKPLQESDFQTKLMEGQRYVIEVE